MRPPWNLTSTMKRRRRQNRLRRVGGDADTSDVDRSLRTGMDLSVRTTRLSPRSTNPGRSVKWNTYGAKTRLDVVSDGLQVGCARYTCPWIDTPGSVSGRKVPNSFKFKGLGMEVEPRGGIMRTA